MQSKTVACPKGKQLLAAVGLDVTGDLRHFMVK